MKKPSLKVKDVMTAETRCCARDTNLAVAAALMLDGDCGILPVVDDVQLIGVVTDRDLYIALATRDKRASEMTVGEVIQSPVFTCGPDDAVQDVLDTMTRHRVRRVPVQGFGGAVLGIVSLIDVVAASGAGRPVSEGDVVHALQAIGARHHPTPHVAIA